MNKIIILKNGISITENNRDLIEEYLLQVNRYVMEYTYNTFDQIAELAQCAEDILDEAGIELSKREGLKAISEGLRPDKNKLLHLKKTPNIGTTSVVIGRTNKGWNLERANYVSDRYNKKQFERIKVYMPKSTIEQHIDDITSKIESQTNKEIDDIIASIMREEKKKLQKLITHTIKQEKKKFNKLIYEKKLKKSNK